MAAEVSLLDRVRATGMLAAREPLVVLLSGGRDSVCLLDLSVRLRGTAGLRALHVNFGLRSEESDGDERACRELCDRLEVALDVEHPLRPEHAGNMHAWARDVRYALGGRLAASAGGRLAVAHTVSDQIETVLYRLASSPGRGALLGMSADRGIVLRPLLAAAVTRAETAGWCTAHDLPWREDSSNSDRDFARTRVRDGLVPAFLDVDARAEANLLRTVERLREEEDALAAIVDELLGARHDRIGRDRLAALAPGLGRLVLRRMAEAATGASCPRAASRLEDVLALQEGALDLGDGARATVTAGTVVLGRTPPLPAADDRERC